MSAGQGSVPPGIRTLATGSPTKPQGPFALWRGCFLGPPPSPDSSPARSEGPRTLLPWQGAEYLQEMDRLSLESITCVSSVMFRVGGVME